jgi:RNA polymerase sigma-70 factor (ECF subfamily)
MISAGAAFPNTRLSLILAARGEDPDARRAAFEVLVSSYWRPAYVRFRLKWCAQPADAEDLTQEFFARAVPGGFFDAYDPSRGRFRTYLRSCLDHFAANARRDERRLKRGGAVTLLPLDFADSERELGRSGGLLSDADPDDWFDREWIRSLLAEAVESLRRSTAGTPKEIRFRVFARHDVEPALETERPSYRALAEEFSLPTTHVTNHLAWARRELRRLVLERIRSLVGSDAEYRAEVQAVFGRAVS